jgi:hypothetical protein
MPYEKLPAGRRMFDVTPTETIALAQAEGMTCVQRLEDGDGLERGLVLAGIASHSLAESNPETVPRKVRRSGSYPEQR